MYLRWGCALTFTLPGGACTTRRPPFLKVYTNRGFCFIIVPKRRSNQPRRSRGRNINNNTGSSTRATSSLMAQPRFKPVARFSRTVQDSSFDVVCDGINPSLNGFKFSLSMLPDYTDFTRLFLTYEVSKIQINWKPEYTELTDAALVSNAINVNFNSAIDQTDATAPSNVQQVIQYQSNKSTGITKQHVRNFIPAMLMDGTTPCSCYISTNSPSENLYGVKVGVPPTGVAMTFRATITYWITCSGAR